ncbi:alpha/beta hydrolase [Marininema halotolerans]|uniref:Acetyl esterase n=1 Tax=Marininema halotolerans TaxID=1155944 RepID=A0A1I6T6B2_9BACL|nr:alpha/beta hydrolase [Marininema halotolerans]SFS84769.1 acetyl esterase [Marininema halotolerans]
MVDKDIQDLLKEIGIEMKQLNHPSLTDLTPEQCRHFYLEGLKFFKTEKIKIAHVINRTIEHDGYAIPIRIYAPETEGEKLPILTYFHGGGWLFGDLEKDDNLCRMFVKECNVIVVSIDYRLSPEWKYPTPLKDAITSVKWIFENAIALGGNPDRIFLCGESSGGNLAAATCLKLRDEGHKLPMGQLLICPALNCNFETASYNAGYAYNLTKEKMQWFWNHYLESPDHGYDPYASPLLVDDAKGLPQTMIVTAELDPLRDEGAAYAQKLKGSNVPVTYLCFKTMVHSFLHMHARSPKAKEGLNTILHHLRIMIDAKPLPVR